MTQTLTWPQIEQAARRRHRAVEAGQCDPDAAGQQIRLSAMTVSARTPGPWTAYPPNGDCDYWEIDDPFGRTATVYGEDEEAEANARLMAASPELLVALETAYAVMTSARVAVYNHDRANYDQIEKAIDEVRAAINKATGNEV